MAIAPSDMRAVLQALRSDHRFLAVRPADATPASSPGMALTAPTVAAFSYAMEDARVQWPQCVAWDLVGCDALLLTDEGPPRLYGLQMPAVLCSFSESTTTVPPAA